MADGEEKSNSDLYAVLGLNKECTPTELRNAYKKLALRWHPDRCSASGDSIFVEEAKKKFQAIQQAYSVLSDANKRFLYDVGAYESDDDENAFQSLLQLIVISIVVQGMGDFLNEMAMMMTQTKPSENGNETFEELQELFQEMFRGDIEAFESSGQPSTSSTSSSYASCSESSNSNNKRNSSEMNYTKTTMDASSKFNVQCQKFCLGVGDQQSFKKGKGAGEGTRGGRAGSSRRQGRKQKVSSGHNVSSNDYGISAS